MRKKCLQESKERWKRRRIPPEVPQGQSIENAWISAISKRKLDIGKPSTYANELLEIPFPEAVS
jgi:hypothetical protein